MTHGRWMSWKRWSSTGRRGRMNGRERPWLPGRSVITSLSGEVVMTGELSEGRALLRPRRQPLLLVGSVGHQGLDIRYGTVKSHLMACLVSGPGHLDILTRSLHIKEPSSCLPVVPFPTSAPVSSSRSQCRCTAGTRMRTQYSSIHKLVQ
jgi:hypothetical protein